MKLRTLSEKPLVRLAEVEPEDLRWNYDGEAPTWRSKPALAGNYGRTEKVDPWGPCYRHEPEVVERVLIDCAKTAPLGDAPVTLYLSVYEGVSRTNGWAYEDIAYYRDGTPDWWNGPGAKPWEGVIVLNGRRVEIHPAVSRYVTAHEYGHLVEDALGRLRHGDDDGDPGLRLRNEFAKLRGLRTDLPYGPGTHHLVPGEVFANDFRTYVMGVELEFWPHPVKQAAKLKRVSRWWDKAIDELVGAG